MRFRLDAEPGELAQKTDQFLEAIQKSIEAEAPEAAEALAKALTTTKTGIKPLKTKAMTQLRNNLTASYKAHMADMMSQVHAILDDAVEKSLGQEIPESLGEQLWQQQEDELSKGVARGGKYIRREPYIGKGGKTKYRYYYKESSSAREAKAGAEIKLGKKGTAKVESVGKEGSVTLTLDGKSMTVKSEEWADLLHNHYGDNYLKSAGRRAQQAVNAIQRHVPKELLEDLKGETDAERLEDLKKKVPEVHDKLAGAFKRAGMGPYEAKRTIARVLSRKNWEADARLGVIGTVVTHKEIKVGELIRMSENLAKGGRVELKHVAGATNLRAPQGKAENFAKEINKVAKKADSEVTALKALLEKVKLGDANPEDALQKALTSEELQKLRLFAQALPDLKDEAITEGNKAIAEISAQAAPKASPDGVETQVYVSGPGGKPVALQASYKLVEASDVIASHDAMSFKERDDYPEGVQERAYHRDKGEQGKVINNAQQLNPQFVINTNPDAVNGPPMMTADGVTLGGNSRVMSMQRAYGNHPDKAKAYKEYLEQQAHQFGISPDAVKGMKNPILMRVVEPESTEKEDLQLLVRQMNESFTQGMDPRTMQVALGRRISESALQELANSIPEGKTLAEHLATKGSEAFVNTLKRTGIIDQRNSQQYLKRGTNLLNADGKTLVSRVLVGRIVQDADILSDTGDQMMKALAMSVPYMVKATGHGKGYDVSSDLRVAIDAFNVLQAKADNGYINSLDPKMNPHQFKALFNEFQVLPGMGEEHAISDNKNAQALMEVLLRKRGEKQLTAVFKDYAQQAAQNPENQASMFGGAVTPSDALHNAVNNALGRGGKKAEESKGEEEEPQEPPSMGLFGKSEGMSKAEDDDSDPEDAPEPGDVDEDTGEVVPDAEEAAEAKEVKEEESDEGDTEKSLKKADKIPGGPADNKSPKDFDAKRLQHGIEVELEHTSDRSIAQEIAMDHLTEDPDYYTKLESIEGDSLKKSGLFIGPKGGRWADAKHTIPYKDKKHTKPTTNRRKEMYEKDLKSVESELSQWSDRRRDKVSPYKLKTHKELKQIQWNLQNTAKTFKDDKESMAKVQRRQYMIREELSSRTEFHNLDRKQRAIKESLTTGKLTLDKEEIQRLFANQGDSYKDRGYEGEYNPDYFLTSSLSGKGIRHYVTLPDNRLAHPDEIHEAQKRGRINVVDQMPEADIDWTEEDVLLNKSLAHYYDPKGIA
jgi:hypothetical protein